jgi:MoxR-like ATPase
LLKYKKQIILQGPPGTGKTKLAKDIAVKLLDLKNINELDSSDQFNLVQFHPSYSYEDFVRGIESKPNEEGDGILYEPVNKTIAKMAKEALDNFHFFNSDKEISRKIIETKSNFEKFIESVQDQIDNHESHKFFLSDLVYIFEVDESRFKYKGDNWEAHPKGLNMKFSELEKLINAGVNSRADVKKVEGIEALSKQHGSYFYKAIEKFREFETTSKPKIDDQTLSKKTALKNYVLIIDEINRANLSSVLGELIYGLEYRGEPVKGMYAIEGQDQLIIPPNLFIIGTMNTADRSVGNIDYAIRRRFAFVDILPKDLSSELGDKFHSKLFQEIGSYFKHETYLSKEFEPKDVQLGHSYFINKEEEGGGTMEIRLQYEIKPILREYVKDGILIGEGIKEKIEALSA